MKSHGKSKAVLSAIIFEVNLLQSSRFGDYLEKNQLFVSEVETGWMCLNCGHIHRGTMAPEHCPVCRHEQGYFVRMELAPYIQ